MKRNSWSLVFVLLLVFSQLSHGQGDDDSDDEDTDVPGSARLSLEFNDQGGAAVSFGLPERPENWDQIRQSLAAALHCPEQNLKPPDLSRHPLQMIDGWPVTRRETYLRYFADYKRRQLTAKCDFVLSWNGFGREGSMDFSALAAQLKQAGMQQLRVSISYPKAKSAVYSKENLSYPRRDGSRFLAYRVALDGSTQLSPVHLSFGLGRRGLYNSLGIAIAFMLLPVGITIYMRRAALVSGKIDPTAAWFSYFRTINWCINGSLLLWITSGLGARQALQDWISLAISPGWLATLLDVAIVIGPAFLVYFICVAVSYPLHVHLRATTWTWQEFLVQQLANVGAQALPLMFFLAAIANIAKSGNTATTFFLLFLLSLVIFRSLKMRVSKSYPYALTRGELRDKVFALARKAGITVTQIFVLPTGKGQVANAYAAGNRVVMFTDYLLQHLSKREVEGVAAHEIAHLQLGHVKKRALTFYAALMFPALLGGFLQGFMVRPSRTHGAAVGLAPHLYSGVGWFWQWSQRDFILMLLALTLFYFVSRRFEHAADERAAALTGDPEAQISGLLKLSRLNLMPIQWGKGTGTWLTHPSTVRRAERIAAASGMPAEQLQAILERHQMEVKSGARAQVSTDDHYAIPEATDPENISSAAKKQQSHQFKLWTSLLMHVIPPAILALMIQTRQLEGNVALLIYGLGAIVAPVLSITYSAWLGVHGRRAQRIRLAQRLEREGPRLSNEAIAVGFSSGAVVRFYGSNYYNWDVGFLEFEGNRLSYRGEQVRFSLTGDQIEGICIGQGGPSWWKFPRIYVRWIEANGKPSVFSVGNLEPCSIWEIRKQAAMLCDRLKTFKSSSGLTAPAETVALPPTIGEITSRSPRELGGLKTNLTLMVFLLPLGTAINAILRTDCLSYIFSVVALTRLIESIPFWRFRDRILAFTNQPAGIAVAAKASQS